MIRTLTTPTNWVAAKWIAWTLFLATPGSLLVFIIWWLSKTRPGRIIWPVNENERYLTEATDLPDLERRMRALERTSGGPAFVTFNH